MSVKAVKACMKIHKCQLRIGVERMKRKVCLSVEKKNEILLNMIVRNHECSKLLFLSLQQD